MGIPEEEEIIEQVIPKDHLEPLMVLLLIGYSASLAKGNKTCYTMTEQIERLQHRPIEVAVVIL